MSRFLRKKPEATGGLDDAFWHWYVDSYGRSPTQREVDGLARPNDKAYTSSSSSVVALLKYFETLKLPAPSANQVIALLKSPFTQGDLVKTFHLIRFYQLSGEGLFITNEPTDKQGGTIAYVGAENWENVMCYMDALLFAMFTNLESFEPMLFVSNKHANPLASQLAVLLRVYVNFLRLGNLITTDLTIRICEVLQKLGFTEAMSHRQQDAALMFEFLTELLAMPLLTFKVDIKHAGKHDKDDQKYLKERILFVSLPEDDDTEPVEKTEGVHLEHADDEILLEECLEHYFNNSISVKRELERRATVSQQDRPILPISEGQVLEQAEITEIPRQDSKLSVRITTRTRSSTLSLWLQEDLREVSLPAWMFLRLLPFYTDDNEIDNNVSVAQDSAEFVGRRPILPICLKRYSFNAEKSQAHRSLKRIVIPPVINLPQFVADEDNDSAPGDYKLILESAVCHRGTSISSGHFVSAIRKDTHNIHSTEEAALNAPWLLYDDMKKKGRVVEKSFKDIFDSEWPYMLFYRLVSNTSEPDSTRRPCFPPKGSKGKYWDDALSPILSATTSKAPSIKSEALLDRQDLTQSSLSVPMPEIPPTDARFVDIRNKYYWFVPDKDKNYYKEAPTVSKSGTREWSISLTPQFRRNSQWSDEPPNLNEVNEKLERVESRWKWRTKSNVSSPVPGSPYIHGNDSALSIEPVVLEKKKHKHLFSHERRKRRDAYKKEKCTIV